MISLSTKLSFVLSASGVESISCGLFPNSSSAAEISALLSYVPVVTPDCTCNTTSITVELPGAIGPLTVFVKVAPDVAQPLLSFGLNSNNSGKKSTTSILEAGTVP